MIHGWLPTAFIATLLAVGLPFWLVPYGQLDPAGILIFPGLVIVLPLAAGLRFFAVARTMVIGPVLVGAMVLANAGRIVVDVVADPTSHNLFPFELALTLIVGGAIVLAGCLAGKIAGMVMIRFGANGARR